MDKREKVLKGLMVCQAQYSGHYCSQCHYPIDPSSCIRILLREAFDLLKALEPNEDWISRKRLKDEIQYYIDEAGWGDEANKVLGWCMEFIDNQMAVKWE